MHEKRVAFAERCAWRAVYLRTRSGWQYFHMGVDPRNGPERVDFFGGVAIKVPGPRRFIGFRWRFPLLWASWGRSPRWWWRLVSTVTHRLDGRYRGRA